MLIRFHRLLGTILVVLGWVGNAGHAQSDAASQRAAIEGMYPVMLHALEAKNFGRARNICDQAILWEPQNPVHHYNLACIEAQAGGARLPHAWGALDLAVALGFNDPVHLQNDPDLAPLRGDPRFADLVRKVVFRNTAGEAAASVSIPDKAAKSDDAESPAPAGFNQGHPVGLFLMTRYVPAKHTLETGVWYFAPDRNVYRNFDRGFSKAELNRANSRGIINVSERELEIAWSGGMKSAAELEREGPGFTWENRIFTPVLPFADRNEIPGVYATSETTHANGEVTPAQELELRADGTFRWTAVSFAAQKDPQLVFARKEATSGQWEWSGLSLKFTDAKGTILRRLAFPEDDDTTVIKPDQLYLGTQMFRRRP